jgi:transposase-like protein/transposase
MFGDGRCRHTSFAANWGRQSCVAWRAARAGGSASGFWPRPGRQPRVDAVTSARFKERIVTGAALQRDGVVAFRAVDAQRILKEEFAIDCSLSSTYRLLHRITLSWLAPRPPPAGRCDGAGRVFATLGLQLERVRAAQPRGARVEVWFQDEARIGQKNSLTRVWGQTGSRPVAPKDLGFASAYLFGAVCPSQGKVAALIMPICNTAAMNHHLCEISSQVAADAHAVVILDGASWHNSHGLMVPSNITLLALPPYSPELNPVERVWHYLRSHWLANSVFPSLADIMDACETQHSAEFKARVAMTALSGEKTLAELSAEFGVHPTMISNWKQELVTRAGELFARSNKAPAVADAQRVIDDLHRKIGQLQVERDFLAGPPAISRLLRGGR